MIVLDTHAWVWWMSAPDRLSQQARLAINAAGVIGVSSISAWEVAMMALRGRADFGRSPMAWVLAALSADERVQEIPVDSILGVKACELESRGFVRDPADRFIYATAEQYDASLVTKDAALRAFDPRRTVW